MQQFYITKLMMLIFSIIVMSSYFYTVCLVCRVLKNTCFKGTPLSGCFQIQHMRYEKQYLRNLNHVQCSNLAPVEKAWFMVPMEYSPSGKGIMGLMEYIPMVDSPSGKRYVLWKVLFQSGHGHGKRLKKNTV